MKKKSKMEDRISSDLSITDFLAFTKLKSLYANADVCSTADLYRDNEGNILVLWYWMNAHGIGPDHSSCPVNSVQELRECLDIDVNRGWLTKQAADKICTECKVFFETQEN